MHACCPCPNLQLCKLDGTRASLLCECEVDELATCWLHGTWSSSWRWCWAAACQCRRRRLVRAEAAPSSSSSPPPDDDDDGAPPRRVPSSRCRRWPRLPQVPSTTTAPGSRSSRSRSSPSSFHCSPSINPLPPLRTLLVPLPAQPRHARQLPMQHLPAMQHRTNERAQNLLLLPRRGETPEPAGAARPLYTRTAVAGGRVCPQVSAHETRRWWFPGRHGPSPVCLHYAAALSSLAFGNIERESSCWLCVRAALLCQLRDGAACVRARAARSRRACVSACVCVRARRVRFFYGFPWQHICVSNMVQQGGKKYHSVFPGWVWFWRRVTGMANGQDSGKPIWETCAGVLAGLRFVRACATCQGVLYGSPGGWAVSARSFVLGLDLLSSTTATALIICYVWWSAIPAGIPDGAASKHVWSDETSESQPTR